MFSLIFAITDAIILLAVSVHRLSIQTSRARLTNNHVSYDSIEAGLLQIRGLHLKLQSNMINFCTKHYFQYKTVKNVSIFDIRPSLLHVSKDFLDTEQGRGLLIYM